jgi:hypothetical protein
MPYPNLLAGGVTDEGAFVPFELYAGESDIVTSQGVVGAAPIGQFVPVARNESDQIVAWSDVTGAATIQGTFSGVGTAADTIVLNGITFTLVAASANSHQVTIGATPTATATNLVTMVNAVPDEVAMRATNVVAGVAGPTVTFVALTPGPDGNAITLSEVGTGFSFAGAATTLAGGSYESENMAIGISAQPAVAGDNIPYFVGGSFNWKAISWPSSITTLAQARRVFDRTPIHIDKLLGTSARMTIP